MSVFKSEKSIEIAGEKKSRKPEGSGIGTGVECDIFIGNNENLLFSEKTESLVQLIKYHFMAFSGFRFALNQGSKTEYKTTSVQFFFRDHLLPKAMASTLFRLITHERLGDRVVSSRIARLCALFALAAVDFLDFHFCSPPNFTITTNLATFAFFFD